MLPRYSTSLISTVYPMGPDSTRSEATLNRHGRDRPALVQPVDNAAMLPNTGGVLYGAIIVGGLLAAESARQENYADTVGAVAIAMVLYWLVHAYTAYTERRIERSQRLTFGGLIETLAQELMIIAGAAFPLVALLICWAVGASLSTAVSAGVYTSAGIIVLVEVGAAVRADLSGRELVAQILFGALFGLMVILLNVLLR